MRTSCVSVDDRVKHERPCARRALSDAYADDEHQQCRHAGEMKKVDPLFSVFSAVNHFHSMRMAQMFCALTATCGIVRDIPMQYFIYEIMRLCQRSVGTYFPSCLAMNEGT